MPHPPRDTAGEIARDLASKGFSVRQLVAFYIVKRISPETLTKHVVRDIVLPETAGKQTCYMESDFMLQRGGAQRARKLVSHAWDSRFLHTVLNIVLDATAWSRDELQEKAGMKYSDKPDMDRLIYELAKLGDTVLESTYWLCIFAVSEHTSICGECWACNADGMWTKEQFAANPCVGCGKPKYNPCPCGSRKHRRGESGYEIDKFGDVVKLMEGLVVSLDPDLVTLTRVWVVREVGEALRGVSVQFRLALGLSEEKMGALRRGEALLPPVSECHATSAADKEMILAEIDGMEGGRSAFDDFV